MSDQELPLELIKEFVLAGHGDFDKVKEMHSAEPRLLDARFPDFDESAIEAAAHMGQRATAEYLLSHGATKKIATAAMLGEIDVVKEFLAADPNASQTTGAHGISLLFHASLSRSLELMDLLYVAGSRDMGTALGVAIMRDDLPIFHWLLAHGAPVDTPDFRGNTPLDVAKEHPNKTYLAILEAISQS